MEKNPNAVALGKLGGSAGKGEAKRRTPEHYAKISKMGAAARWGDKHSDVYGAPEVIVFRTLRHPIGRGGRK